MFEIGHFVLVKTKPTFATVLVFIFHKFNLYFMVKNAYSLFETLRHSM